MLYNEVPITQGDVSGDLEVVVELKIRYAMYVLQLALNLVCDKKNIDKKTY